MTSAQCHPFRLRPVLALAVMLLSGFSLVAQQLPEDSVQNLYIKSRGLQRVGNTFESIWLIDNHTTHVPLKKAWEFDIQHRFGVIENGYDDFFGLYASSNIRLGFSYVPINKLMVGFGFTKLNLLWDVWGKYAILKERNGAPVSLTYFANAAVDTRKEALIPTYRNPSDRWSFFHQLMVARKVTRDFSVQGSINLSHFNNVEGYVNSEGEIEGKMKNDHLSFSILGRYKISDAMAFIANYDQPITQHPTNNPRPNVSFGLEMATPLHAFQIFIGNYYNILPQYNNVFNQNDYQQIGNYLIGFNITRLLDAQEEDLGHMMLKRELK